MGYLNEQRTTKAQGLLKAYLVGKGDKEHILQFALEDWWITDHQAYFNQTEATITIDCVEHSEVLCLSLRNREKICAELHTEYYVACAT